MFLNKVTLFVVIALKEVCFMYTFGKFEIFLS